MNDGDSKDDKSNDKVWQYGASWECIVSNQIGSVGHHRIEIDPIQAGQKENWK